VLRLNDGRLLGYAEFGDPGGTPVMFFHGFPGSRLEGALGHEAAERAAVRMICIDRPGMGLSTFQPGRRMLDWPADVAALADALGIGRFAVGGVSGGGPYAAVCALRCLVPQGAFEPRAREPVKEHDRRSGRIAELGVTEQSAVVEPKHIVGAPGRSRARGGRCHRITSLVCARRRPWS